MSIYSSGAERDRGGEAWATASVRISSERLDPDAFEGLVREIPGITGSVTSKVVGPASIWIDESPLTSGANVADHLAWALSEAAALVKHIAPARAQCDIEIWIGAAVEAQLGVVLDHVTLQRIAGFEVDLVLDLYS